MDVRDEEWSELYERLSATLAAQGREDSLGDGDYWLVDDDWGGHHHKICISNPNFYSAQVQCVLQDVLRGGFEHWGIYVVFEDQSGRAGFIVYCDAVTRERRWP
jgi:hypothetical protein